MILETILALSAVDYDHLARAVQVEAAPNTMDEYCVAASILNRVASPYYPNNVADVVYAPGQYEGFLYRRPAANPVVIDRLKNTEKLLEASKIIGNRTDFKGQAMLPYRVVTEDPMCDPKGNFYHYHWQS
jgi:spore germination cell wall hydrolase CwlJ-like protein